MPSTATTRNRLEKQASGENDTTWGTRLNTNLIDLADFALDGMTSFTLSTTKTLSSNDYAADEARARFLNITSGTGGTVTIPNVEKVYLVRNATSGSVIFTTGSGTTATVATGQTQWVVCIAGNVVYATGYAASSLFSAFGLTLVDDADASAARTTLGLGTSAILAETSTAEFLANTADKVLSTDQVWAGGATVALTDATTIALNMSTFINGTVTLGGNRTLGNPTNPKVGQSGWIAITQDATGSRTLAYGTNWEFALGAAPVLSTAASTKDVLFYTVLSATSILGNLVQGVV
jgi:hypothetical protein